MNFSDVHIVFFDRSHNTLYLLDKEMFFRIVLWNDSARHRDTISNRKGLQTMKIVRNREKTLEKEIHYSVLRCYAMEVTRRKIYEQYNMFKKNDFECFCCHM